VGQELGIVAVASVVLMLGFGGISNTLYGGGGGAPRDRTEEWEWAIVTVALVEKRTSGMK